MAYEVEIFNGMRFQLLCYSRSYIPQFTSLRPPRADFGSAHVLLPDGSGGAIPLEDIVNYDALPERVPGNVETLFRCEVCSEFEPNCLCV